MGTRSLTHIMDDHTEAILTTLYRQMDGYPDGHGADLAEILKGRRMVNGFGPTTTKTPRRTALVASPRRSS